MGRKPIVLESSVLGCKEKMMKRLVLGVGCWCLLLGSVLGQSPERPRSPVSDTPLADVTPTPTESMWLYVQQMRRYDDPRLAVRRNAEARAEQRRARIAAARWLGYSKQRPMVQPTPTTSVYGPQLFVLPIETTGGYEPLLPPPSPYGVPQNFVR